MGSTSLLSDKGLIRDQRGITGLETAIVLIAFVVVASVFAFAVLSTGLLSSEKSKETVLGGLSETSSTISIRGDIIADANTAKTFIDTVTFTLSSAAQASDPVDLSATGVVVTYLDSTQAINCKDDTYTFDLIVASSVWEHSDMYRVTLEDLTFNAPTAAGTTSPSVRADMVFFETPNGGGVFSVGSITWCGALAHSDYDNNVSRITDNVLRRFAAPDPL